RRRLSTLPSGNLASPAARLRRTRSESPPRTPPTLGRLAGGSACPTVARLAGHLCRRKRPLLSEARESLRIDQLLQPLPYRGGRVRFGKKCVSPGSQDACRGPRIAVATGHHNRKGRKLRQSPDPLDQFKSIHGR